MGLRRRHHETDAAQQPASQVFEAIAEELERARALGLRVEGAICAIAVRSSVDPSVVSELQQLDAALQQVAAIRDFAIELARACDPSVRVPTASALERIRLADVRARLAGSHAETASEELWEML